RARRDRRRPPPGAARWNGVRGRPSPVHSGPWGDRTHPRGGGPRDGTIAGRYVNSRTAEPDARSTAILTPFPQEEFNPTEETGDFVDLVRGVTRAKAEKSALAAWVGQL